MTEASPGLKPANQNPWYVLMTLYGEQVGEEVDWDRHHENRRAWNTWAGYGHEGARGRAEKTIVDLPGPDDWHARGAEIRTTFEREYLRRNPGNSKKCPEPGGFETFDLSETAFSNILCLTGMLFSEKLDLTGSRLERRFSAEKAFFDKGLAASQCTFLHGVSLEDCESASVIALHHGRFSVGLAMAGARTERLSSERAKVKGTLDLNGAAITGPVQLEHIEPLENAKWNLWAVDLKVSGNTVLTDTQVNGDLTLNSARFGADFVAPGLKVHENADLGGIRVEGMVNLTKAVFHKSAKFHMATFAGRTFLDEARFEAGTADEVSFRDSHFKQPATFRGAVFRNLYPDLTGTLLHDKTEISARPDCWPKSASPTLERVRETCAALRHSMNRQGQPEAEHFFYRREMQFAGQIGTIWQRLPYLIFGWLSDFGYSIERPLWALFWFWLPPAILFCSFWITGDPSHDLKELGRGMAFSFANLFTVFGLHKLWFSATWLEHLWWPMKLLGGVQTVFSLPLLFFLGLGLRTRFRLR